jgi:hypothetical protein
MKYDVIYKLFFLILLCVICSCKTNYQTIVGKKYSIQDTLIVRNYLFQQIDNFVFNSPQDVADSSIQKFKTILSKLDIPIKFEDTLVNIVDYFFLREEYVVGSRKKNNIDSNYFLNHANPKNKGEVVLFPYFELVNIVLGGTAFTHYSVVKIVVYIVKNNTIIYTYRKSISSKKHFTPNREDIKKNLNPIEDWEKAINGAMKEYINRLE